MRLSIRDEETQRLVRELVERTGETVTQAVTVAIRERLDRIRREQGESLAGQLVAIGRDCAARLKEPFRSADHEELALRRARSAAMIIESGRVGALANPP